MMRYATIRFPHSFVSIAKRGVRVSLVALALMVPVVEAQTQEEIDPWEGYNRWMFDFNGDTDRWIIRPVAKGYDAIMPEFGRVGVNNFFSNFYDFNGALNALLQGRIEQAVNNTFRVVANSTIGLFGLFDVASMADIPRYETDFGHTLSIWGVPRGNFLVLPIIGPSTVRSSFGASIDASVVCLEPTTTMPVSRLSIASVSFPLSSKTFAKRYHAFGFAGFNRAEFVALISACAKRLRRM